MDVSQLRVPYISDIFREENVARNPFEQFGIWLKEALNTKEIIEPNAMCLSTCTSNGKPSSRYMLLKSYSENGFIFFTNYESRKGTEMISNPYACILFFWPELHRQIRIEGTVERISEEESKAYFNTRSKASQTSASISKQSRVAASREELETKAKEFLDQHKESDIPKPAHWGGFVLKPSYFEFWQGHSTRLHDRVVFKREESIWNICRLNP